MCFEPVASIIAFNGKRYVQGDDSLHFFFKHSADGLDLYAVFLI